MGKNELFDRFQMEYLPLRMRRNKVVIENDYVDPENHQLDLDPPRRRLVEDTARQLRRAREKGASRICAFGAHAIKNGLGYVLSKLVKEGWLTHLATNGAGIIHDWEFSYLGQSSEDVAQNVRQGRFGTWDETGLYINLAIVVGAYLGLGYGESVGKLISEDRLTIPSEEELDAAIGDVSLSLEKRAAAADLLFEIRRLGLKAGTLEVEHPYKRFSIQCCCYENGVPFTDHPMFGHDIIYTHKANLGAAVGRTAEVDFLRFVNSVANLENGVYLSVGSAVMSPMIFEKALSMARNALGRRGGTLENCDIHVVDLQKQTWDWKKGEPPSDNPAYYLRFMKSFSRMGCPVDYTSMDNRDFLVGLWRELRK